MFKDKTALVTGSTSGIGLGIATSLAREGADVILNGFGDAKRSKHCARTRRGARVEVRYDGADLSKQDQIEAMMAKAIDDSAPSTFSSTTPAFSLSRRSTSFRSTNGTRSSRSI